MNRRILSIFSAFIVIISIAFSFSGCIDKILESNKIDVDTSNYYSIESIPEFDGETPFVAVENNVPQFKKEEISTKSYEKYGNLDRMGRCTGAIACVGVDIMPTEERGPIGMVKPTGWHTVKYDCVDGKYLYNRCHLLGYQLTGENANVSNLITGTRYLNVDGMLPFENLVADYVKETENHVMYRVVPIFEENDLLAKGVQMEAYSVEDKGKAISYNVFVFNSQPGVEIDYTNGESWLKGDKPKSSTNGNGIKTNKFLKDAEKYNNSSIGETEYVINTNSKIFHHTYCQSVNTISRKNKDKYIGTRKELINNGYKPCRSCNP